MKNKGSMKQYAPIHRLWIAIFILLAYGCVDHDFDTPPNLPIDGAVSFRVETSDDFSTRAAGHTTTGSYAIRSMGIYAGYTDNPWDGTTASNNFFDNLAVSRSGDGAPWNYNNEQLWPGNGYLTFFAYAPHSENPSYGNNKPLINIPATGTPTLHYTIAPTHKQQVDLLVATPVKDQTKCDYVTIPLRHALTKIAFSARVANPPGGDVDIRITEISLSKLNSSGTIAIDGTNRQWTALSTPATYTQTNAPDGGLRSLPLTDIYQSLTPAEGHLFLMPQTIHYNAGVDSVAVTVKYTTTVNGVSDAGKEYTLALGRAITAFHPGMAYNLMITINNGISFIVVPTKWDHTDVQADIKNRILNVTRIEANVYPGVATRIFFWSNQPKDSVYVRKNGNLDNAKYPTGANYVVNDVFQDLSEATSVNLYYPTGFDGVTTASGEGYIDVLMKDKTNYPYLPQLSDGDKRHIWLNASGLARNILLNSIVRGNPTTTPYVGTFHRWYETGERIVTWGYNDKWTVEIDHTVGEYEQVVIDKLPSPFMASGQLYGNPEKNVGNPEVAQLNPAATTAVSGTGRVYFRVGWKSRLANRTETRYARIKVLGTNIGEAGIHSVHLYLRQGEAEDYLMIDDGSRPASVKWSPYNLTAEGLTVGGSVQITANRSNARFVQYPTQAGAVFKWVSYDPKVLPQAYAPVGRIAFDISEYNGFWYPVMSIQESCPPGYRRPNRGSIAGPVVPDVQVDAEVLHSLFSTINYSAGGSQFENSLWGYYADGFFDRHKIEDAQSEVIAGKKCAVEATKATVGYIGRLFFMPSNEDNRGTNLPPSNSLFFPAAGFRSDQKQNNDGQVGYYWSSSGETYADRTMGWFLQVGSGVANTQTDFSYGMSVRCVRDINFSTTLPPYDETGVPTALSFDANAGVTPIDGLFVAKWNIAMARDFRLYTEEGDAGSSAIKKITAKVAFRGTTATGNQTVNTDAFSTALGKLGSSITYDFNHAHLNWASGTSFTFYVLDGWTAKRYSNSSTTATATVVGLKDSPLPIVLLEKGRIVFTRTALPATD